MRIKKYETLYIKYIFILAVIGILYTLLGQILKNKPQNVNNSIKFDIIFYIIICSFNIIKLYMVKNGVFSRKTAYNLFRIIELGILSVGICFLKLDIIAYVAATLTIIITSFIKGTKYGFIGLTYVCLSYLFIQYIIFNQTSSLAVINAIFISTITAMFIFTCGVIYKENDLHEKKSESLLSQLELKYEQLNSAQMEVRNQNKVLKETNEKLEDTNKKLSQSIAEFYTLQMISQAISSILDIKELLKYVNDIIIGIMGVNNSHILLFDESIGSLYLHTTNLIDNKELSILKENINCHVFMDVLDNSKPIIDNNIIVDKYPFIVGRDIRSFICIPLYSKSTKLGLILIEHKQENAFEDNAVRLLDVIGQQIGITLENAMLYKNMQDMATLDGLTGIYNRLYFQSRIVQEFNKAREGNYELSVAIFDIDHFKNFNDTYGHLFGDKVIKSIAGTVKESIGENDVLARYGGEEFVLLYPKTGLDDAYEKVEKLRMKLEKLIVTDGQYSASVTASFGVGCFPDNADDATQLLKISDKALYHAKDTGRNRVVSAKML